MLTETDILGALPALQKYARRLVHRVDAEDLIQDTLTHAWAKRARYHGGDVRAWLFTLMHNVHVSKIRRISAQPRAVNTYPLVDGSSLADAAAFLRQAVLLAAVATDGYYGMAARLNMNLGTF